MSLIVTRPPGIFLKKVMKNILVPCDFSTPAIDAFKMAVDIALKSNGTITVLHVVYFPVLYDPNFIGDTMALNPSFLLSLEDSAKKEFEKMVQAYGRGLKIDFQLVSSGMIESLKQICDDRKIDLVVMGTSGASGLEETLIGSNTEKIVRFSEVPVLTVRKASDINAIKNILLPTTGVLNQTEFVAKVKVLQEFFNATVHVLLINTPAHFKRDAEGKEALEEYAKHYHLTNHQLHFRNYHNEEEGIINFASNIKADLIVMATHARKGLAHLFTGSITEDVVNHIKKVPVWTYTISK